MFHTLVKMILTKDGLLPEDEVHEGTGKRSMEQIVQTVIDRRLRKIEALRAHLTNKATIFGHPRVSPAVDAPREGQASSITITKLSTQQNLILGRYGTRAKLYMGSSYAHACMSFYRHSLLPGAVKLLTQLMLAIYLSGPNPPAIAVRGSGPSQNKLQCGLSSSCSFIASSRPMG
jgi:hypothetical protein